MIFHISQYVNIERYTWSCRNPIGSEQWKIIWLVLIGVALLFFYLNIRIKFYKLNSHYYDFLIENHELAKEVKTKDERPYISVAGIKINGILCVTPLVSDNKNCV